VIRGEFGLGCLGWLDVLMACIDKEVIEDLKTLAWACLSSLVKRIFETGVDISKNDSRVFEGVEQQCEVMDIKSCWWEINPREGMLALVKRDAVFCDIDPAYPAPGIVRS
jgi:hypothetical protein